jgi:hypothetical protein
MHRCRFRFSVLISAFLFAATAGGPAAAEMTQRLNEGGDADPRADIVSMVLLYEDGKLGSSIEIPGADPDGEGTWLNNSYVQWNLQTGSGELFQVVLYFDNGTQSYSSYVSHNEQRIECLLNAFRNDTSFAFALGTDCLGRPKTVAAQSIAHMDDSQMDDAADPTDSVPDNEFTRQIEEN